MAESDNILTKLQDLMLYLIPETRRGPSDAYDGRFKRRSRLCHQYLEISFVALCSQSLSAANRIISTAANHLGAFGAGSLRGVNLPSAIKI
jgi:hypothetical protein